MDQGISRRGENNLPSFGSMCILQYIACSICSYQCDKYTCLDIHIRAGVLVIEKISFASFCFALLCLFVCLFVWLVGWLVGLLVGWLVVCCLLFVVCCLLFVVCCLLIVVCCLLFVVCRCGCCCCCCGCCCGC